MAQGDTHDGLPMYGWRRLRIMLDTTRATDVHIGTMKNAIMNDPRIKWIKVIGTDLILIPVTEKFDHVTQNPLFSSTCLLRTNLLIKNNIIKPYNFPFAILFLVLTLRESYFLQNKYGLKFQFNRCNFGMILM